MFVVLKFIDIIYAKVYMGKTKTTTVLQMKIGFIILALNFHNKQTKKKKDKKNRVCV